MQFWIGLVLESKFFIEDTYNHENNDLLTRWILLGLKQINFLLNIVVYLEEKFCIYMQWLECYNFSLGWNVLQHLFKDWFVKIYRVGFLLLNMYCVLVVDTNSRPSVVICTYFMTVKKFMNWWGAVSY